MHGAARTVVSLWIAVVADVPEAAWARYRTLLTDDEADRHDRFVFERHRREYLVTRALARAALSRHRDVPPDAWRFARDDRGKPALVPPCGLAFNLSNHPSMVVCAVTEEATVGVDVEPLARGDEILELAETVFSTKERAAIADLERAARAARGVSLWTAKEAYIKARGDGLSLPLQAITIGLDDDGGATTLTLADEIDDGATFTFGSCDVLEHRIHVAVATRSPLELRVRRLIPLFDDDDV